VLLLAEVLEHLPLQLPPHVRTPVHELVGHGEPRGVGVLEVERVGEIEQLVPGVLTTQQGDRPFPFGGRFGRTHHYHQRDEPGEEPEPPHRRGVTPCMKQRRSTLTVMV
jgi:hypothetical protein